MSVRAVLPLGACLVGSIATLPAADCRGAQVDYREDFETAGSVSFWTAKGEYTVNFAGLTSERSHSGKQSYKLDITFHKDGQHNYWAGPTIEIPAVAGLTMTGHIYVETNTDAAVGLGASFYSPALAQRDGGTGRGMCHSIATVGKRHTGRWIKQQADLAVVAASLTKGDPVPDMQFEKWYLHIECGPGQDSRLVVHIDDISIKGTVPDDWDATSRDSAARWLADSGARKGRTLDAFERKLTPVRADLDRIIQALPNDQILGSIPEQPWGGYARELLAEARAKANELVQATAPGRTELPSVPVPVSDKPEEYLRNLRDGGLRPLEAAITNLALLAGRDDPCLVFVQDEAVSNYRILPTTRMMSGVIEDTLTLFAAPGEYEPASFVLLPAEATTVTFDPSDLRSSGNVIEKGALDLKVVKVWYQAGIHHTPSGKSILTPELLLNDDGLVTLDTDNERNIVRDIDAPRDAPALLPVHIPAMTAKQFWLTVHVPDDAAPGTYTGTITVRGEGLDDRPLQVVLRVLPIKLESPAYEFSLYYRSQLTDDLPDYVSSDFKTPQQLAVEFRNLKAHGITNPDVYQRFGPLLDRYMDIRDQAGLTSAPFYFIGMGAGAFDDEQARSNHMVRIREAMAWARGRGIQTVYFAGSDEARGAELLSQRKTWEAVHEAGGKLFVATSTGFFDLVGDLLDLPIIARESKEDVARVHALGHKMYYYSNPAGATEQPYTFRYKFGHWLDRSGMDGVHTYVYQHGEGPGKGMGRMWDDFDFAKYRTLGFTYPTVDGVVDTLQWEGVREGIDDVRYLTTLRKAIAAAKRHGDPAAVELATQAEDWLAELNVEGDLQKLRRQIADRIIAIDEHLPD